MDDLIRHPLAYARRLRDWSQTDLAHQVRAAARRRGLRAGTTRQRVSLWEQGTTPDAFSQELLADVFGVSHDHVSAVSWPHWLPGYDALAPLGKGLTITVLRGAAQMAVDRRAFLTFAPAALGSLAWQWAALDPALAAGAVGRRQVDLAFVDWLESAARHLTTLPTAHRQHTGPLLDGHLTTVVDLLEHGRYSPTTGARLHALAAALAQTIAWHRFDNEHHAAASRYWHAAVHAAHQAGDTDLGAGVLSDLGYQQIWLGRPRPAVEILDHALSRTATATARSLLLVRKARAHAMLGEARDCYRALALAENSLNTASGEAPAWCAWMGPADLVVDTGRCLSDLGQTRRAHEQISEGIRLLPEARNKTKAVFFAYEAGSALEHGEAEQAAHLARRSLHLARQMGASRCVQQIRSLASELAPHRSVGGVDRLLHDLATAS
ncbi:helix-turn-helix transcriptional regulator [Streptomyces sp. HK10]|uniref:helix-turn-helix transcriptional regulator n=1 Tax=Streptomyces sp. HK10 TaxID=3373255 RepID=UPI0037490597